MLNVNALGEYLFHYQDNRTNFRHEMVKYIVLVTDVYFTVNFFINSIRTRWHSNFAVKCGKSPVIVTAISVTYDQSEGANKVTMYTIFIFTDTFAIVQVKSFYQTVLLCTI